MSTRVTRWRFGVRWTVSVLIGASSSAAVAQLPKMKPYEPPAAAQPVIAPRPPDLIEIPVLDSTPDAVRPIASSTNPPPLARSVLVVPGIVSDDTPDLKLPNIGSRTATVVPSPTPPALPPTAKVIVAVLPTPPDKVENGFVRAWEEKPADRSDTASTPKAGPKPVAKAVPTPLPPIAGRSAIEGGTKPGTRLAVDPVATIAPVTPSPKPVASKPATALPIIPAATNSVAQPPAPVAVKPTVKAPTLPAMPVVLIATLPAPLTTKPTVAPPAVPLVTIPTVPNPAPVATKPVVKEPIPPVVAVPVAQRSVPVATRPVASQPATPAVLVAPSVATPAVAVAAVPPPGIEKKPTVLPTRSTAVLVATPTPAPVVKPATEKPFVERTVRTEVLPQANAVARVEARSEANIPMKLPTQSSDGNTIRVVQGAELSAPAQLMATPSPVAASIQEASSAGGCESGTCGTGSCGKCAGCWANLKTSLACLRAPATVPPTLGATEQSIFRLQRNLALAEYFTVYREDFLQESTALNATGERHLEGIWKRLGHAPAPVKVEPTGLPDLDGRRRDVVVNSLVRLGVSPSDAQARVIIAKTRAEGLRGLDIEVIPYPNLGRSGRGGMGGGFGGNNNYGGGGGFGNGGFGGGLGGGGSGGFGGVGSYGGYR